MQSIEVDFNRYGESNGVGRVIVGFVGEWQLASYDLQDGTPALFVQWHDLEMQGVLRRDFMRGKECWYGIVDPRTQWDFIEARLTRDSDRAEALEKMEFFHDGDAAVFYDDEQEVYGTIIRVTDADGSQRWEGVVDWSTRRDPMTRPHRYDARGSATGLT